MAKLPVPLGIFDDPPPEDSLTIKSVQIKKNVASRRGKLTQDLLDDALDLGKGLF